MEANYVLKDRKHIFFYNRFCLNMSNIRAIQNSDLSQLVLNVSEKDNFIEKLKQRVDYNKQVGYKKRVSFN